MQTRINATLLLSLSVYGGIDRHYEFIKNVIYDSICLWNNPGFVFFHILSCAAQSTANKRPTSQVRGLYSADLFFEQLGTLI